MAGRLSEAGLMPMTASPEPYCRPSMTEASTPRASSVGWLGCRREEKRPGRPMVSRKRVTTLHLEATSTRSWMRMSLLAAATISGVRPGARAVRVAVSAAGVSSQSRSWPTVKELTGAKACASWLSMISRVTSSVSYGTTHSDRKRFRGTSARAIWARMRSSSFSAAMPASTSPERKGEAFASSSRKEHFSTGFSRS